MCSKQDNDENGIPCDFGVHYLYTVRLCTGVLPSTMIAIFHICCCSCLTRLRVLDLILMSAVIRSLHFVKRSN